ncbi:unnamed protein product [Rhodiola kirilowii]
MSSTAAPPPPVTYSGFFGGYGNNDVYDVSDAPPLAEAASPSSPTGVSNSVVIIVIVFSITVIVSISLCFIIRVLSGRCNRRSQIDVESGSRGGSSRVMASRRVQPVDEEYHQALPILNFESVKRGSGGGEKSKSVSGGDCPICLSKFEPKDALRLLPICCHAFHAECVDVWLESNQSCPLCRSAIVASEAEILQKVLTASTTQTLRPDPGPTRSFIDQQTQSSVQPVSLVRAESENKIDHPNHDLNAEIGANRSWLRDYMDTLSSRTVSLRSSTRYFTGSSRRSLAVPGDGYWDIEASRAGEEISEMFRWFSGI